MDQTSDRKKHWEKIYTSKALNEVSWYQPTPKISLELIEAFGVSKNAAIIDVGGGDSLLIDHLLDLGYSNITILDISEHAIERAKNRLGDRAVKVKWIVSDVILFEPTQQYDLWHDRATFHFLTNEQDIQEYSKLIEQAVIPNGKVVMGTFSETGPTKCSGIEIKQYSEVTLTSTFKSFFEKIKCFTDEHITPFNTVQNFLFCTFSRKPTV